MQCRIVPSRLRNILIRSRTVHERQTALIGQAGSLLLQRIGDQKVTSTPDVVARPSGLYKNDLIALPIDIGVRN